MIKVEGYKAFHGDMMITPKNKPAFYICNKDWLYKPDTKCWYCNNGQSFPVEICDVISMKI